MLFKGEIEIHDAPPFNINIKGSTFHRPFFTPSRNFLSGDFEKKIMVGFFNQPNVLTYSFK